MAHTAPSMDTPQMPDATYQPQHSEWPHSSPVLFTARAFQLYQDPNSDYSAQNLPGVVSQGFWAGSVPSSGATLDYSDYPDAHPGGHGEVAVEDELNECDEVPCLTRTEGRKGSRKRGRDWTEEETSVLVGCKRACFEDKGSRYRKHKSSATNWDAIAEAVRKTGDQCRLRWDTLVKSHRLIKERCVESGKEYAEVMAEETRSLKLATTLKPEWYEVIDSISGKSRSRKESNPGARKSKNGGAGAGPVIAACMARTEAGSHTLVLEGGRALGGGSIPAAPGCPGMSKPRRKAVQRFWSLGPQLRSTLLDLILSERLRSLDLLIDIFKSLSRTCEWLSAVQSRSRSDVYDDVSMLMQMRLVHVSNVDEDGEDGDVRIDWSRFRVPQKFVKKLIGRNPVLDTHRYLEYLDDKQFSGRECFLSLTPHRIRVLTLYKCNVLESIDLRGLRKLRSLTIWECGVLKEISGWKYLRELGWLEIFGCEAYADYPDLRDLPSLRVCILVREYGSVDPGHKFDISQCVRLRRLEIYGTQSLKESGDLSSLKCLEELKFCSCDALSTVDALSGLHSLTRLVLRDCKALHSLPDIGHMKELAHIDISCTSVEEIPGIEKLVSLMTLDCFGSKLKHLPDLHHLPMLQCIRLSQTPLLVKGAFNGQDLPHPIARSQSSWAPPQCERGPVQDREGTIEDDPSSFYFDKYRVSYYRKSVEVSDMDDDEGEFFGSFDDEDEYSG